jgi:hypothetical protein
MNISPATLVKFVWKEQSNKNHLMIIIWYRFPMVFSYLFMRWLFFLEIGELLIISIRIFGLKEIQLVGM